MTSYLPEKIQPSMSCSIEAVFFDLDGTLVTTSLDFAAIREELGYAEPVDFIQEMQRLPAQESARIATIIARHEKADAELTQVMPGAVELVHYCKAQGWPVVVVTRNSREIADIKLSRAKLDVDRLYARDDAMPAKPDPTVFHQLFKDYQLQAANVMYLGDYIYDIQTARNAGMISGLIYQGHTPDYAAQADVCVRHLAELQAWLTVNQAIKHSPEQVI